MIAPQFDDAKLFSDDRAPVRIGNKWGYIDKSGTVLIQPEFADARAFQNGLAVVTVQIPHGKFLDSRLGAIDTSGKKVVPVQFATLDDFDEVGHAAAELTHDGKVGFIDRSGDFVIRPMYGNVYAFHAGLAAISLVYIDGSKGRACRTGGYIDLAKKLVIPSRFPIEEDFGEDGFAIVCADDDGAQCGFIDRQGNVIIKPQFPRTMIAHSQSMATFTLGPLETNIVKGYVRLRACAELIRRVE